MSNNQIRVLPADFASTFFSHQWWDLIADFSFLDQGELLLEKAIATPSIFQGPESALGMLYDRQGKSIDLARHRRRDKDFTAPNPPSISVGAATKNFQNLEGTWLYLGWYFNHYGHFLLESFARTWLILQKPAEHWDGILFHLHGKNGAIASRNLELLNLLGIKSSQVRFVLEPVTIERLVIPAQRAVLSRGIHTDVINVYRVLTEKAMEEQPKHSHDALYVSRRLLGPGQRSAVNELQVEQLFRDQGYSVIHPETLSPTEQIQHFAQAKRLAGFDGSGLHNALFCSDLREMTVLASQERPADCITQLHLNKLIGCPSRVYLAPPRNQALRSYTTRFIADIEEIHSVTDLPQQTQKIKSRETDQCALLEDICWSQCRGVLNPTSKAKQIAADLKIDSDQKQILEGLCMLHAHHGAPAPGWLSENNTSTHSLFRQVAVLLHLANERLQPAITLAQAGAIQEPHNSIWPNLLSQALLIRGDGEKALKYAEQALEKHGENPEHHFLAAKVLHSLNRVQAACQQLEIANQLDPSKPIYRRTLAVYLKQQGRLREAAKQFESLCDLLPGQKMLHLELARLYCKLKQTEAAKERARYALRFPIENRNEAIPYAQMLMDLGWNDRALVILQDAIEQYGPDQRLVNRMKRLTQSTEIP